MIFMLDICNYPNLAELLIFLSYNIRYVFLTIEQ